MPDYNFSVRMPGGQPPLVFRTSVIDRTWNRVKTGATIVGAIALVGLLLFAGSCIGGCKAAKVVSEETASSPTPVVVSPAPVATNPSAPTSIPTPSTSVSTGSGSVNPTPLIVEHDVYGEVVHRGIPSAITLRQAEQATQPKPADTPEERVRRYRERRLKERDRS